MTESGTFNKSLKSEVGTYCIVLGFIRITYSRDFIFRILSELPEMETGICVLYTNSIKYQFSLSIKIVSIN